MKYLLDSNAWIALLRQKSVPLIDRLQQHPAHDVVLCSVVLAELWYGAWRSGSAYRADNVTLIGQLRNRYHSLAFDDAAAQEYARIRFDLEVSGQVIGPNDLLIAAIASANGLTLVTHNTSELRRVAGLPIEDWQI